MEFGESSLWRPPLPPNPPNNFTMISLILYYPGAYNHRAFERRPSLYAVSGILENLGPPVFCDQAAESQIYDLVARGSPQSASTIGCRDMYQLLGRCDRLSEIQDCAEAVSQRLPLYAEMISPSWFRPNADSLLWTSVAMVGSEMTGGPWADSCEVYF